MKDSKPRERRLHSAEFKSKLIAQCARPGTSVAKVALDPSLNCFASVGHPNKFLPT